MMKGNGTRDSRDMIQLTSHRETTETPLGLQVLGLTDGSLGRKHDGVQDEAVLVSLNLPHHLGLRLGRAVVMDDTQTTEQSHVDGHVVLGDGVHGRGKKRSLQRDTLGHRGVQSDLGGREACVPLDE